MSSKAAKPSSKNVIGTLTDQMRAFAAEYTIDFNGRAAAIRAGYAEKSAAAHASRLLSREDVQALVQQRMARIEKKTEITTERLVQEAFGIATADVNDLVEFRRRCCRHCYGIDFGYQRTMQEVSADRRRYELQRRKDEMKADFNPMLYEEFDEQGGDGYDARKPPHPECNHCWGDGVGDAFFKATANLSKDARALYAGVKQTKEGYQMLLIDKLGAMEKLYRHMGLYKLDNDQKGTDFTAFIEAVQTTIKTSGKGGKLPIKE